MVVVLAVVVGLLGVVAYLQVKHIDQNKSLSHLLNQRVLLEMPTQEEGEFVEGFSVESTPFGVGVVTNKPLAAGQLVAKISNERALRCKDFHKIRYPELVRELADALNCEEKVVLLVEIERHNPSSPWRTYLDALNYANLDSPMVWTEKQLAEVHFPNLIAQATNFQSRALDVWELVEPVLQKLSGILPTSVHTLESFARSAVLVYTRCTDTDETDSIGLYPVHCMINDGPTNAIFSLLDGPFYGISIARDLQEGEEVVWPYDSPFLGKYWPQYGFFPADHVISVHVFLFSGESNVLSSRFKMDSEDKLDIPGAFFEEVSDYLAKHGKEVAVGAAIDPHASLSTVAQCDTEFCENTLIGFTYRWVLVQVEKLILSTPTDLTQDAYLLDDLQRNPPAHETPEQKLDHDRFLSALKARTRVKQALYELAKILRVCLLSELKHCPTSSELEEIEEMPWHAAEEITLNVRTTHMHSHDEL